jgi:hypothetical protein
MKSDAGDVVADHAHVGQLAGVSYRPVFIMGSARSGTSILYRLLTLTERFNYVSAYHLIDYDQVLANHFQGRTAAAKERLAERFRELGIAGARFDGVEVSPDFPEEYGFGLDGGYRMQLRPRTLPRFQELCRKVQLVSVPGRPLLLKNPWDSRNFLFIKQALPESRFIFIHRNPADVVPSLLEGMRSLLQARNAYHALLADFYDRLMEQPWRLAVARLMVSPRFQLGTRLMSWQVTRMARYFVDNVGRLGPADHVSVRYEDLCKDPGAVVNEVLRFLGLAENSAVPYGQFIRVRGRRPRAAGDGDSSAILKRPGLEPYLAYCGYEHES